MAGADDGLEDYLDVLQSQRGGFNFELAKRNARLSEGGAVKAPVATKTGTTICGLICKDAVIIGADTRSTRGNTVSEKKCEKLHVLAQNMAWAGAGTAADLHHQSRMVRSQLELHRLATGTQPRVITAMKRMSTKLFNYQGNIGCTVLLGGVDVTGPQLFMVHSHGSTELVPFSSGGSGCLHAIAELELGFKDDMTIEEGKLLCSKAVRAGIFNDLYSGGCIDLCVITKSGMQIHRDDGTDNKRKFQANYKPFVSGTTPVLKENIYQLCTVVEEDVVMRE